MIIFHKVKAKNFFSIGNQPIEIRLDEHKTTSVSGSNGAGKSSCILDTIFYALFNKPFRNIRKPNIVNSINDGGLEVELNFTASNKNYKIIRGMKPNIFEIYENGNLINQDASVRDYQKFLEQEILGGLNEKVFKQVVVIGSADYQPFMQLRTGDRREVIEELLDITIFSSMLQIAKEKLNVLKSNLKDIEYNIKLTSEKVKMHTRNLKKRDEEAQERKNQIEEKIRINGFQIVNEIEPEIKNLKDKKETARSKVELKAILESSVKDIDKLNNTLNNSLSNNMKQIAFFDNNNQCPTCKQEIEEEHKNTLRESITSKVEELKEGIERVQKTKSDKKEKLTEVEKYVKLTDAIDKKLYKLEHDKAHLERSISELNKEMAEISSNSKEEIEKLSALKDELSDLLNLRKTKMEDQDYYYAVHNMLKDTGIKSKIIEQYIPVMNQLINDYLIRFGLPIEFTLDDNFNEVIKSRFRDAFQYNNFSEGEKQRIDSAILLAWRQLARSKNTTNTNLLILDEVFDSSLDATATDELLNILLEMNKDTNIFIISHKMDLSEKLDNTIYFEKPGNFTQVKSSGE